MSKSQVERIIRANELIALYYYVRTKKSEKAHIWLLSNSMCKYLISLNVTPPFISFLTHTFLLLVVHFVFHKLKNNKNLM
jgi:hypothetical protein